MIQFTEAALIQVQKLVNESGAFGLKVGVKKTGCSGYSYFLEPAKLLPTDTEVLAIGSLAVYLDKETLPLIQGCQVDYVRKGLNRKFVFHNPNSKALCGCGESFTF